MLRPQSDIPPKMARRSSIGPIAERSTAPSDEVLPDDKSTTPYPTRLKPSIAGSSDPARRTRRVSTEPMDNLHRTGHQGDSRTFAPGRLPGSHETDNGPPGHGDPDIGQSGAATEPDRDA